VDYLLAQSEFDSDRFFDPGINSAVAVSGGDRWSHNLLLLFWRDVSECEIPEMELFVATRRVEAS
jgi:hypothetical protein